MKPFALIVLLCFFSFTLKAKTADTLTGIWKSNIKGVQWVYHFSKDSILQIQQGKDTLLSVYKLDTANAWPKAIDVHVLDRNTQQVLFIQRGLVEFMGPGRIRWRLGAMDQARPTGFLPRGNEETQVLTKQP